MDQEIIEHCLLFLGFRDSFLEKYLKPAKKNFWQDLFISRDFNRIE